MKHVMGTTNLPYASDITGVMFFRYKLSFQQLRTTPNHRNDKQFTTSKKKRSGNMREKVKKGKRRQMKSL